VELERVLQSPSMLVEEYCKLVYVGIGVSIWAGVDEMHDCKTIARIERNIALLIVLIYFLFL
jgi:hypothetical protein